MPNGDTMTTDEYKIHIDKVVPAKAKCFVTTVDYADSADDFLEVGNPKIKKLDRAAILNCLMESYAMWGLVQLPTNMAEVFEVIAQQHGAGDGWGNVRVETPKQHRQKQEAKEREVCEHMAAAICTQYRTKPNSLDFIRKVVKHYKSLARGEREFRDNPEIRAERMARCAAEGNILSFYKDNDYASSKIYEAQNGFRRLWRYLHRHCPLLMAQYKERRLRRKK
jgi:hypothetical protein